MTWFDWLQRLAMLIMGIFVAGRLLYVVIHARKADPTDPPDEDEHSPYSL